MKNFKRSKQEDVYQCFYIVADTTNDVAVVLQKRNGADPLSKVDSMDVNFHEKIDTHDECSDFCTFFESESHCFLTSLYSYCLHNNLDVYTPNYTAEDKEIFQYLENLLLHFQFSSYIKGERDLSGELKSLFDKKLVCMFFSIPISSFIKIGD